MSQSDITDINLREALESRYLAYALSTITNRALPDVRDGLKPVHRRLLFAMRQLKLDPESRFKKCARVVGDVIGRYHPHGDQAVYDALVRLAQDFAVRYPLIDGQGNFGNIDGDGAAAMRYTEAKMTQIAYLLLKDINDDTVDFRMTYDEEEEEPIVLPAFFPNLLANGSSGIAVGMATNIPPHNIGEVCDVACYLIKRRDASIKTLMKYIKGPDFPTGGVIVETPESICETYIKGRGSIRLRACYVVENLTHSMWQIIITEMPYKIQKTRLIDKIAELIQDKKLPMIEDIRDESAEDIRLIIVPKSKNFNPQQMMMVLFQLTDLEIRYAVNFNVLDSQSVPRVLNLRELLLQWLDHRKSVLIRKSKFRVTKIETRLEILDGYLITYLNLDEVIRIIRVEDNPLKCLMQVFNLTQNQGEAILNMRLRSLRKLEEWTMKTEYESLSKECNTLKILLNSDEAQWKTIKKDIQKLKKQYDTNTKLGARRTGFADVSDENFAHIDLLVNKREPITIILSQKGWVRTQKGHVKDKKDIKYKEGDKHKFVLHAQTNDKIILFSSRGRSYALEISQLPEGRGYGEPLNLKIDMDVADKIIEIFPYKSDNQLLVASKVGKGFIVNVEELMAMKRSGKQILNVELPDEAVACVPVIGDYVAVLGKNKKLLCFSVAELPNMGRGKGVRLQNLANSTLIDIRTYNQADGLVLIDKAGRSRLFDDLSSWEASRAKSGRVRPRGFPSDGTMGDICRHRFFGSFN